jgi:hypothetical protein
MDRTKVMALSDKVVETRETNPINIALLEVEADAIELVDLSEDELKQIQVQSQMANDEAELLEALRSRMTRNLTSADNSSSAGGGGYDAAGGDDEDE